MKKRLLRPLFALTMAFLLVLGMSAVALAKESESHHDGWTETKTLPTTGGSYILTDNVELSSAWDIPKNTTINLCLNGHVIKAKGSSSVITVSKTGAKLNLWDCDTKTPHYFTVDKSTGLWTLTDEKTDHCIYGGVITGGNATNGGGINVATSGSLTMNGVAVVGNNAKNGGGIYTRSNTELTECNVVGNTADLGGGIYEYNVGITFTLKDSTVKANKATSGGGIYAYDNASENKSTLEVEDSLIEGNIVSKFGGGIYADNIVDLKKTLISKNEAKNGGGIYAYPGASPKYTSVTLSDSVEVSKNKAESGGGISVTGNTTLKIGEDSKVISNTSGGLGGGVLLNNGAKLSMSGEISGNEAATKGGGIYTTAAGLEMKEGKISENTAPHGGGLFVYQNEPDQVENVILGGVAKITDNEDTDGNPSNVYTDYFAGNSNVPDPFYCVFKIDDPCEGFEIGIDVKGTDGLGPFTINGEEKQLGYFTADDPNKTVKFIPADSSVESVNFEKDHFELVITEREVIYNAPDGDDDDTELDETSENVKSGEKIYVDPNGGTWNGFTTAQDVVVNKDMRIEDPTREDYTFMGWEKGTKEGYAFALTAIWTQNTKPIDPGFGGLTISKKVTGDLGDTTKYFTFKVKFDAEGTFNYTGSKSGTITSGGTVQLKHGESITIVDIPAETNYEVTESGNSGYTVYASGDKGVIADGKVSAANFINARNSAGKTEADSKTGNGPKTGDDNNMMLWIGMMGISILAVAGTLFGSNKKRKKTSR